MLSWLMSRIRHHLDNLVSVGLLFGALTASIGFVGSPWVFSSSGLCPMLAWSAATLVAAHVLWQWRERHDDEAHHR